MQLDLKRCIALRGAIIPPAAIQLICDKGGPLASLRDIMHSDIAEMFGSVPYLSADAMKPQVPFD